MQMPDLFFADFDGAKESLPATDSSEDCLYLNIFVPDLKVRVHKGSIHKPRGHERFSKVIMRTKSSKNRQTGDEKHDSKTAACSQKAKNSKNSGHKVAKKKSKFKKSS